MTREEELAKQGWEKKSIVSEPRLSEVVEMYESLGLEVRVEPVDLESMEEECRECFENEDCRIVYTRPKRTI